MKEEHAADKCTYFKKFNEEKDTLITPWYLEIHVFKRFMIAPSFTKKLYMCQYGKPKPFKPLKVVSL